MTIDIPDHMTTEEKLLELIDTLESIKTVLGGMIDEMDSDGKDTDNLDDAMESLDDAVDSIGDAVDELEEEEFELDEAGDEYAEESDGIHVGIIIDK